MEPLSRPTSNKSSHSYLSWTSHHSYNSIDGLNIIHRKMNVFDFLKNNQTKQQIRKNILFEHPFPLLEIISKRKILNNSTSLLKNLIKCNQKSLLKTDEKYIIQRNDNQSQMNNENENENENDNNRVQVEEIESKAALEQKQNNTPTKLPTKPEIIESKTSSDTFYSFTSLPKVEKRTIAMSNFHRKSHDSNMFNRNKLFKDHSENFAMNAYKLKKLYMNENFINKIKNDVFHLKFNRELRICYDLIK